MVQVAAEFNIIPNKHILIKVPIGAAFTNVAPYVEGGGRCLFAGIWTRAPSLPHRPAAPKKSMPPVQKCCRGDVVADLPCGWMAFGLFEAPEHSGWSARDNAPLHRVPVINAAAPRFDLRGIASAFVQPGRVKCGEMSMTS